MNPRMMSLVGLLIATSVGCAEGPFWRLGRYNPWVVKKWEEENRFALSLDAKRATIRSLGRSAAKIDRLDSEQSVARLSEILHEDDQPLARIEAARVLGECGHPRAVAALETGLRDEDIEVRIAVCTALGKTGSPDAVPLLAATLQGETESSVRLAAARGLGKFDDPGAMQALVAVLDDRSPAIQYRAIESLRDSTGQDFGPDIERWQAYARGELPAAAPQSRFARLLEFPWK
ncbi:MAG TPA: hypothetical protein DCQ98_07020 [Planctomycetaceae bacterium]|nr:hypothetical protein [Planctomycetaceae bacterium]HRF02097.1 HEAT repeat domain-containing protein [Pirellulaceae bacterium]